VQEEGELTRGFKIFWYRVLQVACLVLVVYIFGFVVPRAFDLGYMCRESYRSDKVLMINGNMLVANVQVAGTEPERVQGLSGKACIPKDSGMLFVFDNPSAYGIWMKDMKFPIDIVWLGADKRIMHIEKNAEPSSYPKVFTPITPALYVLEVKDGHADKLGLKLGDKLNW
jgi:uncharacterized membrane protein (UPF0127 family)